MAEFRQVNSDVTGETPESPLFRPDALDLLGTEYATNLSYYRNYSGDDTIAAMLLGCILDIIDCTNYTLAKTTSAEKSRIVEFFVDSWQDGVLESHLLEGILDPGQAENVIAQHSLLIETLREKYQWLIRGPRDICWRESTLSVADELDSCSARSRCLNEGENRDTAGLDQLCTRYFSSWRGTMLALENREELLDDPAKLADEVRKRCRVLSLLSTPEGLEDFLDHLRRQTPRRSEDARTVRGVIVRLLTMFVDQSLAELSRKIGLPPDRPLNFSSPVP